MQKNTQIIHQKPACTAFYASSTLFPKKIEKQTVLTTPKTRTDGGNAMQTRNSVLIEKSQQLLMNGSTENAI